MYSAMIFLVESERLRLMRSESKAIAKRKHEQRRKSVVVWFLLWRLNQNRVVNREDGVGDFL